MLDAQRVPTVDNVDASLVAVPQRTTLQPLAAGAADTEENRTRRLVPLPPKYISMVIGCVLTPREAWEELAGAMRMDGLEGDCAHLIDWLRVALTLDQDTTAQPPVAVPPVNCVLLEDFLTVDADQDLNKFHWLNLRADLLALDPTRVTPADPLVATIGLF